MSDQQNESLPATQERAPVEQQRQVGPFDKMLSAHGGNVGSIEIESQRAIAEAQGQLTLAKKFPRSMAAAHAEFMEACGSIDFAQTAFYSVPNRGSGPSIRFAEECARCYGNFQYGHRELSRQSDRSEVEVYAWDMQNNNYSKRQITVMHILDTKQGPRKLTDQADIDNRIANIASKQMRGRILALLPKGIVAAGVTAAKRTLAGGNTDKPLRERLGAMAAAFAKFGVNSKMLETHLGHAIDDTTIDELADLTGIYNAIKDGAKASDHFKASEAADKAATGAETAKSIAAAATKGAAAAPAATPAPSAAPAPAAAARPAAAKPPAATAAPKPTPKPTPAPTAAPEQEDTGPDFPDDEGGGQGEQGGGGDDVF